MANLVKLSEKFIGLPTLNATSLHRSIPEQIEYWARLSKAVEDNPDLPFQFIKNTLQSIAEADAGQVVEFTRNT